MKSSSIILLVIHLLIVFNAGPVSGESNSFLNQCELRDVVARLKLDSMEKAAAIAEQSLSVMKELKQIVNKAENSSQPIKDQLSTDDMIKFTKFSQRLKTMQLAQLIESHRQRDLMVIEKMTIIADRDYRWNDYPAESDPDFFIYSTLQMLKFTVHKSDITSPSTETCTLDTALYLIEHEAIMKLNNIKGLVSANSSIKAILAKYNMEKIDRSRLSKDDLEKINDLDNNILKPAQRHSGFIKDIEDIKLMAKASEIKYEANKQDIAFGGGDIDAIGKTIQRKIKNTEIDEDTQLAIGYWNIINEKMPSKVVHEWKDANKLLEKRATSP